MPVFQLEANITANDRASGVFNKVRGSAQGLKGVLGGMQGMVGGVMGGLIGFSALNMVKRGLQETIQLAGDYEYKLKQIKIFGELSAESTDKLGQEMLKLSKTNVFSVIKMQDAMIGIVKAGVPGADALNLLKGSMLGAQAGGEDLNAVTEVLLKSMNAFQLDFSDSTKVMDMLTIAANKSQAQIVDIGVALGYVAPVAYSANQSIGDMVAAISYLTKVGFEGSKAGVYLRQTLMKLADPTKEAKDALQALGLSANAFKTHTGAIKALPDVIVMLREKLLPLKREGKDILSILAKLFDTRAASAMAALIEMQPEKWTELRFAIDETGVVLKQASDMMLTYKGRMDQFNATMDSLKITLGSKLLPIVSTLALGFSDMASAAFEGDWTRVSEVLKSGIMWAWEEGLKLVFTATDLYIKGLDYIDSWLTGILNDETLINNIVDNFFNWLDDPSLEEMGENKFFELFVKLWTFLPRMSLKITAFAAKLVSVFFIKLSEEMWKYDWAKALNPFEYAEWGFKLKPTFIGPATAQASTGSQVTSVGSINNTINVDTNADPDEIAEKVGEAVMNSIDTSSGAD